MTTIQFTYDKDTDHYCFGVWKDGSFIVRAEGNDKDYIWGRFLEDLKQLEGVR